MKSKANQKSLRRTIAKLLFSVMLMTALFTLAVPAQKAYAMYSYLDVYTVRVESGYLALRTVKAYERSNEIGELYTGDIVIECPTNGNESEYKYVYSPRLHKHGYVNANYIYYRERYDGTYKYACVETGYLALRTAKAYESRNEIGKLYTGDPVIVLDDSDYEYWTVYAPTLYKTGYVNCNYLVNNINNTDNGLSLGFPNSSYGEWYERDGDTFDMHVQVLNYSNRKTVSSFTILYCATDSNGNFIDYDGYYVFEDTNYVNVECGATVYTDYFCIPRASKVKKVYVEIQSVSFTDGTSMEYPSGSRPMQWWTIN